MSQEQYDRDLGELLVQPLQEEIAADLLDQSPPAQKLSILIVGPLISNFSTEDPSGCSKKLGVLVSRFDVLTRLEVPTFRYVFVPEWLEYVAMRISKVDDLGQPCGAAALAAREEYCLLQVSSQVDIEPGVDPSFESPEAVRVPKPSAEIT